MEDIFTKSFFERFEIASKRFHFPLHPRHLLGRHTKNALWLLRLCEIILACHSQQCFGASESFIPALIPINRTHR